VIGAMKVALGDGARLHQLTGNLLRGGQGD
jgi:hypothetical protein